MASSKSLVDRIVAQASEAGDVRSRAMFGEYGIYCDDKIVALVCRDELFLKSTKIGRELLGGTKERSPYPGAKKSLVVPESDWDNKERMVELFKATCAALPKPKKKARKRNRAL